MKCRRRLLLCSCRRLIDNSNGLLAGLLCARWAGRTHFDSTSENARQSTTTMPQASGKAPNTPCTNSVGVKAAMVVSTPKVAGVATRYTPFTTLVTLWPCTSCSA